MTVDTFALKDRLIGTGKEVIEPTASVSAGNTEETTIMADAGEIWEVIGVRYFVSNDQDATSGMHKIGLSPIDNPNGFADVTFSVQASYDGNINLKNNFVSNGTIEDFTGDAADANTAFRGVLITNTEGIVGVYENNTDATQEKKRRYILYVNKYEA